MVMDKQRAFDGYLVAATRAGDRHAFGLLVERWHPRLTVHAWRLLGDREAAADAVQDGWAEIVGGIARLRDDAAFAAWAYRIVSRRCARQIRRTQAGRRLSAAMTGPAPVTEADTGRALDSGAARRALDALPPGQKAAVALFYLEDLSIAEVAVALDVPAGTVKTRLMHARHTMRAALAGDE